jgi:transcriptional regulator with XRE-family HTH domain
MSEPTERAGAAQRVRDALSDLNTAYERRDAEGVSISEMARAIGVSHTEMSRIISGDHKLGVGQMLRLPKAARRVVMAIINGENDVLEGRSVVSRSHTSRGRRYAKLAGDHSALLDEFEADGIIDHAERERLRVSELSLAAEATAGARDDHSSRRPS